MKPSGRFGNLLTRRNVVKAVLAVAVLAVAVTFYWNWLSPTRIAFVNYQPISLQGISQANDNPFIRLASVDAGDVGKLARYDIVLVNGMGLRIDAGQREAIRKLADGGTPVFTSMATNPEDGISNFTVDESALVQQWLMSGGKANYRSLLSFLRRNVDGKIIFTGTPEPAVQRLSDYLYHPAVGNDGDEAEFTVVAEYERFLRDHGLYHEGAPKVVVTGQITDPTDLILALEARGTYNVYPIYSLTGVLGYVREIRPDAVVNMAHGRLGDEMVDFLKENGTLLLDPLTIMDEAGNWEDDPMGMSGGFMSQSVVMPEIDGAIRTQVVFAQERDAGGLLRPCAIGDRLEEFVATLDRYMALRSKPNGQKRLAIVYFKGPGQAKLVASGLDVVPSLYNLLLGLRSEGYDLDGLPSSLEGFRRDIEARGPIFNSFAKGDAARFMEGGDPELVTAEEYSGWVSKALAAGMAKDVDEAYGAFPGDRNALATADGRLAFARVSYGNVVLLPQPMAAEGDDEFKIVHGTDRVPPHSYIAPYLWARYAFQADALVHFGTHGSLEFTPGKQVALSARDWPDRLVGFLPHFYVYTVDNVGEAMTAKRRSYAQTLTYLTPPYRESGLRGDYAELEGALAGYSAPGSDKAAQEVKVRELARRLGLDRDLGIDASRPLSDDDIDRIGDFSGELVMEKVCPVPYVLGVPYSPEDVRSSVFSMAVDPIAYGKYNLERLQGKAGEGMDVSGKRFERRYVSWAKSVVSSLYDDPVEPSDARVADIAGITTERLEWSRELIASRNAPKGMAAMMMAMARKDSTAASGNGGQGGGMAAMMGAMGKAMAVPEARNNPVAKVMRRQARRMMSKKDPAMMLKVAKRMGASDEALGKMSKALEAMMGPAAPADSAGGTTPEAAPERPRDEVDLALAIEQVETAIRNVHRYRRLLLESPALELSGILGALSGGYTPPSPGGDPIANPNILPTGRNLFAINAEETPSEDAWARGKALAEETIKDYMKGHDGEFPRKVSYTLWSGEFIQTGGATIAQLLYMLGVEPVRDRYGRVEDLRLIDEETLGRPRIDVVAQTSGQLRDLAASRLFLISRAVRMAADAPSAKYPNYVREGVDASEGYLVERGVSPKRAREMAGRRVFGGLNGGYGSGIQGMVERGDLWDDEREVAERYMENMGAYYGDEDDWEGYSQDAFAAALTRTDVVVQPRQSNSWGALSLDHVYEFMGGMSLAVRQVTGKDPDAYFSDYRNRNHFRVQDSRQAIGVEARTKLLNPDYIEGSLRTAGSADALAEMVRNAYGWNVMKPGAVDERLWDEVYEVYVEDRHGLGVGKAMGEVNPAAMQEITATMMETARKGYWEATPEQLARIAEVHTGFVNRYGPAGTSFEADNAKLRQFIADNAGEDSRKDYLTSMRRMEQSPDGGDAGGMLMERQSTATDEGSGIKLNGIAVAVVVAVAFAGLVVLARRRRKRFRD